MPAYSRTNERGETFEFDFPVTEEQADAARVPSIEDRLALFVIEQAVYKTIAEDVSTRQPGNLRSEVDAFYVGQYESTGAKSFDLRLGGEKVGTASVKQPSTRPKKTSTAVVVDADALLASDDPDFDRFISEYVRNHIAEIGRAFFDETGCVPGGMDVVESEPEKAKQPTVSIRVDAERVADVMGANRLGGFIHGMLGGE